MESLQRRQSILTILQESELPMSATTLAKRFSVSRQVVVGDVALLRASGTPITATQRGYVLTRPEEGLLRPLVCRHAPNELEQELCLIVDQGCTVVDVVVDHPVYGELIGGLHLSSRYDVAEFIRKVAESDAAPLSVLTAGIHLHTVRCSGEASFLRVKTALDRAGFLVGEPE